MHPGDWGYGHNIRKIKQRIFDKCCWSSLDFTTLLTKSRLTSSAQHRKWFRAYSEKDLKDVTPFPSEGPPSIMIKHSLWLVFVIFVMYF